MTNLEKLVNRVITDAGFAQALVDAPEQTLRSEGIEPTPEILDAVNGLDAGAIQRLAKAFGDNPAAA
jgi:hypothetical protein